MSERRAKYKQKGDHFGDLEYSRISRVEKQDQRRKEIRSQNFSRLRPLEEVKKSQTPGKSDVKVSRNEKLEKWKKQKELKKKTEKKKVVKPPFKVGIVHHKIYSPPISNANLPSCSHWNSNVQTKSKTHQPTTTPQKRITRVTEKRLAAKAAKAAASAAKKSFAPPNYKFKPPAGITDIPLFGRVRKGSMDISKLSWNVTDKKSPVETAVQNSKNSRKKSNSSVTPRKSKKMKISFSEKSPKNKKTRLSSSRARLNSDSSSSPVFDDEVFDNEVFDSETDPPSSDVEFQKSKSPQQGFADLVEPLETSISPIHSTEDLSSDPNELQIETQNELEQSINYSPKLQVTDSSDRQMAKNHFNKIESNNSKNHTLNLQANLSDRDITNSKTIRQDSWQDHSLKSRVTDLSEGEGNHSKTMQLEDVLLQEINLPSENADNSKTIQQLEEGLLSQPENKSDNSFNDTQNVAMFSPYVVTRRGKKEARKEQQLRRGFNHSPEEIPTKETVMQNLNISIDEEKRTAQYFRCLLESEANRLSQQCDSWDEIISTENPPEEAKESIEQAIGQTRLLLRSKFKQFEGLVHQCEQGNQDQLVTCKDLQGFWDMINLAVKNCEDRFEKVVQLKANNWVEQIKAIPVRKRLPSKKKSPKKKSPPKRKSNLRAMIQASRQKKKEIEENSDEKPTDAQVMEIWRNVVRESPSNAPTSTRRLSTASVESASKTERRMSFARAALMISQKRKSPEQVTVPVSEPEFIQEQDEEEVDIEVETASFQVHLDESISYINSKHTPGRSILKRVKVETTDWDQSVADDSRSLRSTQKVNFNDKVELKEVQVDEETKNKLSLAASLARIDSMNFEDEYVPEVQIRAEKKLNFEDMSFNESLFLNDDVFEDFDKLKTPKVNIVTPTPKSKKDKSIFDLENFEKSEEKRSTRATRNRNAIDSQNTSAEKIKDKMTPKSPRSVKKSKLNSDPENLVIDLRTPKSPKSAKKSKLNSETETLFVDVKTAKSPSSMKKRKPESDLENSLINETKEMKITPKSPGLSKKGKFNSSKMQSIDEEVYEETKQDEDVYRRSLRNRTVIGNLTPRSAKKLNKDNTVLSELGKSPIVKDVIVQKTTDIPSYPLLDRVNSLRSSKKLLRSPILRLNSSEKNKTVLSPLQHGVIEDESVHQKEGKNKLNIFSDSKRKTPRKMEETKDSDKKATPKEKKESESPSEKLAKMTKDRVSLLYKLIKSPLSSSKKSKNKGDTTESMEEGLETESKRPQSSKSNKKPKTPKAGQTEQENEDQEDSAFKKEKSRNVSLIERKTPKAKSHRSLKFSEDEVHNEKENASPGIFNRTTTINSPKPIETPSKRKSIKRSMSCHVAECQIGSPLTPQLQRSNSSRVSKTPSSRRSINPVNSVSP